LASDALAIQIVFPSVGVTQSSFRLLGLPALPDKQKITLRYDLTSNLRYPTIVTHLQLRDNTVTGIVPQYLKVTSSPFRSILAFNEKIL
jgi:hypothetical protein